MPKSDTYFKKGNKGKEPGTQNNLTKTVKETVLSVFNDIQADPKVNLKTFAKNYPRDFYQIAARLIPTEIHARLTKVTLEIVRTTPTAEHTVIPEHAASLPAHSNGNGKAV